MDINKCVINATSHYIIFQIPIENCIGSMLEIFDFVMLIV